MGQTGQTEQGVKFYNDIPRFGNFICPIQIQHVHSISNNNFP